jgi:hypothetical protein
MTPNCSTSARCSTTSGLVAGHRSEHDRFEVDGANAARDFLREHGVSGDALRTVWDAIALHTTPGIPETQGARSRSGYGGVEYDVLAEKLPWYVRRNFCAIIRLLT